MQNLKFQGDFASNGARVNLNITLFEFMEDGVTIIYSPNFDLSGYGKTPAEAKQSFEVTVHEFFNYTIHKNTLESEMKRLGWVVKSSNKKKNGQFKAPDLASLITKNAYLQDILNEKDFVKYGHQVSVPC